MSGARLRRGEKTNCGCAKRRSASIVDITGQRFGLLTALYPTGTRTHGRGDVIWHCRCDCGTETDVSYSAMRYGSRVSCGCRREQVNSELQGRLTHIAGTSMDAIKSRKPRRDNTSGHPGVYRVRNRFRASITFGCKTYYLGGYATYEEALKTRLAAEEALFDPFIRHYEAWRRVAEADPDWAVKNPITVEIGVNDRSLAVRLKPDIPR